MAISLKENYLKSIYLDYADEYQIFIIMRNVSSQKLAHN